MDPQQWQNQLDELLRRVEVTVDGNPLGKFSGMANDEFGG